MKTAIFVIVLSLLGACGWSGDPEIYDMYLDNRSKEYQTEEQIVKLKKHIRATVEMSAAYWGVDTDIVSGWRLVIKDLQDDIDCWPMSGNAGCTTFLNRTITVQIRYDNKDCFEYTSFLHELGHVKNTDPLHWSPGWWDPARMQLYWDSIDCPEFPRAGQEPTWRYSD